VLRHEDATLLSHEHGSLLTRAVLTVSEVAQELRWDLRQIFRMAVAEGHIVRNPAELLFIPRETKRPEHTVINLEEVQKCFSALEQRERLIANIPVLG
jgi:hypothetical protein